MSRLLNNRKTRLRRIRGLSLIELLMAVAIMGIIATSLGALAMTMQQGNQYAQGHGEAAQHARVITERIQRAINEATATEAYPGFLVVDRRIGEWSFPDTLIVWHPTGEPANPQGPPLIKELVFFTPSPVKPNHLLEIRSPSDKRSAPPFNDLGAWQTVLDSIRADKTLMRVPLTELLRVGEASDGKTMAVEPTVERLGMIRFEERFRPSQADWSSYKAGDIAWENLAWPQNIRGAESALRQHWCSIEIQLMPGEEALLSDPAGQTAITFFGSGTVYHELKK